MAKMRASLQYNEYIRTEKMVELSDKYLMDGLVGDQDWLTLLGWELPSLFYILPCQFNWKTNSEYSDGRWAQLWLLYRRCPPDTRILHRNGRL